MKLLLIAAAMLAAAPVATQAATCTIIIYYSDPSLTRPVGSWSNCPGQKGLQGKRTRYKETETQQIAGGSHPGPGSLPCEFLASGCSPIPSQRHQL